MSRLSRNRPLPDAAPPRVDDGKLQRAFEALFVPLREVIRFLQPFVQPEKWKPLPYLSGWGDYADVAWNVGQYRKNPLGRVELRGLVARTSGATTEIAVLPESYRPSKQWIVPSYGSSGAGRVDVYTSGVLSYNAGGTTYLSLDGISFDTED